MLGAIAAIYNTLAGKNTKRLWALDPDLAGGHSAGSTMITFSDSPGPSPAGE